MLVIYFVKFTYTYSAILHSAAAATAAVWIQWKLKRRVPRAICTHSTTATYTHTKRVQGKRGHIIPNEDKI